MLIGGTGNLARGRREYRSAARSGELRDRRFTVGDLLHGFLIDILKTGHARGLLEFHERRLLIDEVSQLVVDDEDFVDRGPPAVPGAVAFRTALPPEEF